MTICVFLGPTVPQDEAKTILDGIYLPPVRRGDILKAVQDHQPETVAIIDGYFEQVPSVWHKEILWALSQGIRVCGAASMGAMRAAELSQFGMEGTGQIYHAYLTGRYEPFEDLFEDDDEVAVVHGPAEIGYAASEAMVDIRATLVKALSDGIVNDTDIHVLANAAKALFYKMRTWNAVLDIATGRGVSTATATRLSQWLPQNRLSQKRIDAMELLVGLRDGMPQCEPVPFRFEQTLLWESAAATGGQEPIE